MSTPLAVISNDDPRDSQGEVKLSLPETWQVESVGEYRKLLEWRNNWAVTHDWLYA